MPPTPRKKATPNRARVVFEVIDDEHVRVRVEWPPGSDVSTLGIALKLINAGKMVEQQQMSITGYGGEVGDPEAAIYLCGALRQAPDRPLIRPTEVVERQMRMRGGGE